MKRLIFAIAFAGLISVQPASAQSGFYFGVAGGGSFFFDQSFETDVDQDGTILDDAGDVDVSYDTGYNIEGQIGYQVDTNIRIEAGLAYLTASGERTFSFDTVESDTDQDIEILQVTAGVFLDLWPISVVVPYIGGGIGYANVVVDNDDFGDDEQDVLLLFAEGGIPYNVTPSLAIVPSVRINWYHTEEKLADDLLFPIIGDDLFNTDLRLGARLSF